MEVRFSKRAVKYLKKLDAKTAERVREKILQLLSMIEVEGVIPFNELDVKKLKGQWDGYFRLRVGQIRVIFTLIGEEMEVLLIYDINVRGSIYE
jgi:mRNA interferase RelE/StbE